MTQVTYLILSQNSRSQMFFQIGVLKNFSNFTAKHLSWSLCCRLSGACFSVKLSTFLRKTFFTEHLRWLLLDSGYSELMLCNQTDTHSCTWFLSITFLGIRFRLMAIFTFIITFMQLTISLVLFKKA